MGDDDGNLVQCVPSFDTSYVQERLDLMWQQEMFFGRERNPRHVYTEKIGTDRWILMGTFRRVDNPFGFQPEPVGINLRDQPIVIPTVAHAMCVDRCLQGQSAQLYKESVGAFFAFKEASGIPQIERNFTLGGGAEEGAVLAHVTAGHSLAGIINRLQDGGHPQSFFLHGIDIQTHVGLTVDSSSDRRYGVVHEYHGLGERPACGAIVGMLRSYDPRNRVHLRLRADLGEHNYRFLSQEGVHTLDGIDITYVVAAAIIAVQGLENTLHALPQELHPRALAHLTASVVVNETASDGHIIYLCRATGFNGTSTQQGFGTDASQYSGSLVKHHDDKARLELTYNGSRQGAFPVARRTYIIRQAHHH